MDLNAADSEEPLNADEALENPSVGTAVHLNVPRELVKRVKDALEARGRLDKSVKILPSTEVQHGVSSESKSRFLIPTTDSFENGESIRTVEASREQLLRDIGLEHLASYIGYSRARRPCKTSTSNTVLKSNKLARTVYDWLNGLPTDLLPCTADHLITLSRWSYLIYPPMLLLPSTTFTTEPWPQLLSTSYQSLPDLYSTICEIFGVSHLALDAPIPSLSGGKSNILRSPTDLSPLHGHFGPSLPPPPEYSPNSEDFKRAFWCSTSQNGITQIWAPRYTMFSRGNLSEKKRILEMASLREDLSNAKEPRGISVVDLYSGIGYFSFSYIKAGVSTVLCWELNPWSIEGIRRGAEANGWKCRIAKNTGADWDREKEEPSMVAGLGAGEILVFPENNIWADMRVERLRSSLPPIRHVNCGILGTTAPGWDVAVACLDPAQGGWIHVHENVPGTVTERKFSNTRTFKGLAGTCGFKEEAFKVSCEHVEIVKSYSPCIKHCVFDIAILPVTSNEPP